MELSRSGKVIGQQGSGVDTKRQRRCDAYQNVSRVFSRDPSVVGIRSSATPGPIPPCLWCPNYLCQISLSIRVSYRGEVVPTHRSNRKKILCQSLMYAQRPSNSTKLSPRRHGRLASMLCHRRQREMNVPDKPTPIAVEDT